MKFAARHWLLKGLALLACTSFLTGCGFVHDEVVTGPYRLVAVDIDADMSLCYSLGNDAIGRVNETVFAVGWNDTYVVAKQHPDNDRKITHYYFIERSKDGPYVDPPECVTGPLTEMEFRQKQQELNLPAFSRTISSLE
ncbi:hypothetical protein EI77_03587 [Prosthecobacter fusiformis]|uniref:DUF3997 domain-containing protein n=1 Tax=Prosthecobacter fusiformis TaxID=48464 RepID=A0A4R7RME4_9BACT|nr:hypothetical protein [Prosthecobacter fusiformis]TDU66492.1 hypothetical protein EI77_03587 [Prosthecobacter fusiformis]